MKKRELTLKNKKRALKYSAIQKKRITLILTSLKRFPRRQFYRTVTSHGLFESWFSQLQNALSFESKATHLRLRGHEKEKVHVFYSSNFR